MKIVQMEHLSVSEEKQTDKCKILLGTDVLSEGFNLNRAGVIINYDIPYNPTRVVQRIGRINRINKKMVDSLDNFFSKHNIDIIKF